MKTYTADYKTLAISKASATSVIRPSLAHVHIAKDYTESTDGYMATRYYTENTSTGLVLARDLKGISKKDTREVLFNEVDEQFPDTSQIFDEPKTNGQVDTITLNVSLLKKLATIAEQIVGKDKPVTLHYNDKRMLALDGQGFQGLLMGLTQ